MSQVGRIGGGVLKANIEINENNAGKDFLNFKNTGASTAVLHLDPLTNRVGINMENPSRDVEVPTYIRSTDMNADVAELPNFTIDGNITNNIGPTTTISSGGNIRSSSIATSGIEIDDNSIMSRTNQDIVLQVGTNERVRSYADLEVYGDISAEASPQPDFDVIIAEVQKIVNGDTSGFLYPFLTSIAGNGFAYGDINNDGSITTTDVNRFSRWRALGDLDLVHMKDHFIPDLLSLQATYPDAIDNGGKIQFTGNLTFGDDITQDTVAFNDAIRSDILPDVNETFRLGREGRRWDQIWANSVETNSALIVSDLIIDGISMAKRMGNTFYVDTNGDDTNTGDHPRAPMRTIAGALAKCDASIGGPVTVSIMAGTYQETLPLILPPNVTVRGDDLRNVTVVPESGSEYEDVFLLDGESGVENITIKDFYYDSGNDKGYAFRFNPGATVTSRSPYIRNCTVITKGSVITADDPRGFNQGDAGKGALVDGAALTNITKDAAMLFHAATFITPGVDALTMTNGCRVEWLNSFTYFANRGIYATQGTGRTTADGSTLQYGAEMRSIGSANVYGNIGAEADGANCILYLINHNFAYIGSGKNVENDETTTDVTQIAIQANNGKIYYSSTEQNGNFRVGDDFFVNFKTGSTSIDTSNIAFDGLNSLTLEGTNTSTTLSSQGIDVGNLRMAGNTLFSLSGDVNFDSIDGNINFLNNVNIEKNLDITGDVTIDGALITFGNQFQDTVTFNVDIDQNLVPDDDNQFMLGNPTYRWKEVFTDQVEVGGIRIFDNVITTKDSNANLELVSNSAGVVGLENVTFRENTISTFPIPGADSSLADSHLNLDIGGDFLDIQATGFVLPNGNTAQQLVDTDDVDLAGGLRFNTQTNLFEGYADARVTFGGVYSDDQLTNVRAHKTNNSILFEVEGVNVGQVNAMGLEIAGLQSDSILINNNQITTVDSNADLELRRTTNETIRLNGQEYVRDNIFTNANNAGAMTIANTDRGYTKFTGTDGVALPITGNFLFDDVSSATIVSNTVNNSDVFATSAGGVTVQPPGSGTTDTDGFPTYNHYLFTGTSNTSIETQTYDLSTWRGGGLQGKVIVGSNSNGGQRPEQLETLELQFTTDNGTNWSTLGTIASGADSSAWTDFELILGIDAFGTDVAAASGSIVSSEFGSADNSPNQSFRLNIEDLLGFEPDNATITSVEFRGDFGDNNEYVDVEINGVTYRIGETEDIGDTDQWIPSSNLTNVDISAALNEVDFKTGFDVLVSPSSAISFDSVGIGNWWELRFNIDATRDEVIIDTSAVKFRIHETVITSDDNDNFGLTEVALRTSIETSTAPAIGAIRFNVGTKQEEVYDGTQWIASTGQEEDPVTDEIMEDFTNIWSLTLG